MNKNLIIMITLLLLISGAGATTSGQADDLYAAGLEAFQNHSYEIAEDLFNQSLAMYILENDNQSAKNASLMKKRASWILLEMTLNQTTAKEILDKTFPNMTTEEKNRLQGPEESIQIQSDGEVRYFYGITNNAIYHNITMMQDVSRSGNHSPFFDEVYPLIIKNQSWNGTYGNPHSFMVNSSICLPRSLLPENGTLKIWMPLPVQTESQRNISILSIEPEEFIKTGPDTTGDLGDVYFEIPLSGMKNDTVNISADYRFTTYERRFQGDPGNITPYDLNSPLYIRYTSSQPNIEITPEVRELAEKITGNEQNPYRRAKLIYEYIITTYPYSNVPHTYLSASGMPESSFFLKTGFGDCGTQSMLFSALCRSLGIPARSAGGYQLAPGLAGPHFWAEFYLPGYDWIPVDVTIAESADWAFNKTPEERQKFKDYYFGNMDPYRYTIQNDVDIPFSPDTGRDIIMTMVHQTPSVVCSDSNEDLELAGMQTWKILIDEDTTGTGV